MPGRWWRYSTAGDETGDAAPGEAARIGYREQTKRAPAEAERPRGISEIQPGA